MIKQKNYIEIGVRLKKWAILNYNSVANLEKTLGMKPQALSQYTSGRNKPGPKLLSQLII